MKKTLKIALLILTSIWLVISAYFYLQHNVTIWNYSIERSYNVEDIQVNITEVYVKNYEDGTYNVLNRNKTLYTLAKKLPFQVVSVLFKLNYFYSDPYKVSKEYGTIGLRGRLISDKFTNVNTHEYFTKNLEVGIIDDINKYYSSRLTTKYEDNNNFVEFISEGNRFPLNKLNSTLKIYIKNKQTKDIQQYDISPKFIKNNYGYFKKVPNDFE